MPNVIDITWREVQEALKGLRRKDKRARASITLLDHALVDKFLLQRNLPGTVERRASALDQLLSELVLEGLLGSRRLPSNTMLSSVRQRQVAEMAEDWRANDREREVWSVLYHFYFAAGQRWKLSEIAAAVRPDLVDRDRTISRRLETGYVLIADRLNRLAEPTAPSSEPPTFQTVAPRPAHDLPLSRKSFVGRQSEVAALSELLETAAMVTLIGPGGCGKTRLAETVAAANASRFADGLAMIRLGEWSARPPMSDTHEPNETDAVTVWEVVAQSLGVPEQGLRSTADSVCDWLRFKSMLIIMDNCEHLANGVNSVCQSILDRCPSIKILATTQRTLAVDSQYVRSVAALGLPELDTDFESIVASDAVRLFRDRADQTAAHFQLDARSAATVADICRTLDGLPLAIELAAAAIGSIPLEEISRSLAAGRYAILNDGTGRNPHHRTWSLAASWSYELLSLDQRSVFNAVSVFQGAFDPEAAMAVAACSATSLQDLSVILDELIARSILEVEREPAGGSVAYRMLELIRAFGRDKLVESGQDEVVWRRYVEHLAGLVGALAELEDSQNDVALGRVEASYRDCAAALQICEERDWPAEGLRLANALWPYWSTRGRLTEAKRLVLSLVSLPSASLSGAIYADALRVLGNLAWQSGHVDEATTYHRQFLECENVRTDPWLRAIGLNNLALCRQAELDFLEALNLLREVSEIMQAHGTELNRADALFNVAGCAFALGNHREAEVDLKECLARNRLAGDSGRSCECRFWLANLQVSAGNIAAGQRQLLECREEFKRMGLAYREAEVLWNLADVELMMGLPESAYGRLVDSLKIGMAHQHLQGQCGALQGLVRASIYTSSKTLAATYLSRYRSLTSQIHFDFGLRVLPFLEAEIGLVSDDPAAALHRLAGYRDLSPAEQHNPEFARAALTAAWLRLAAGQPEAGLRRFAEYLAIAVECGYKLYAAEAMLGLAGAMAATADSLASESDAAGRRKAALVISAAANANIKRLHAKLAPYLQDLVTPILERTSAGLRDGAVDEVRAVGAKMRYSAAAQYALQLANAAH